MMFSRDGITGLVCLAVSLGLLLLTWNLPPAVLVPIGPAVYPRVVLAVMAVLSGILIALDLAAARRKRAVGVPSGNSLPIAESQPNYFLVVVTFIVFGLYIVLLPGLGFRIATFLFVAFLQAAIEWPTSWKRWLLVIAVAAATSAICYLVFENYLSVLLPRGQWSGV